MKYAILIFFAIVLLLACQQENKKQINTQVLSRSSDTIIPQPLGREDTIRLFEGIHSVAKSEGDTVAFISLSDIDTLGIEHESQLMPNPESLKAENSRYIPLDGPYRDRLLKGTRISEGDSLFIYNYARNTLHSIPVRLLNTGAMLNVYRDESDMPHEFDDYMYGLEIDSTQLLTLNNPDSYSSVIYIGAENPFVRGGLKPIIWKKIDSKLFPSIAIDSKDRLILKDYSLKACYEFKNGNLHYYIQQYTLKNDYQIGRVIVIDLKTRKVVLNSLVGNEEGGDFTGILQEKLSSREYEQYTGYLLKNKPPVIFGLEYSSFGSRSATYLDGSRRYVTFNSDNRH